MRKAPDYKLVFRTFEALMEFVSIYKIQDYSWEKYNGEYYLSFEPNQEFRKWLKEQVRIKKYRADFPTKKDMEHFINKYQDYIRVIRFQKMYVYGCFQWVLYYEADKEFVENIR